MVKVLFVCMGNICRSPTAEGVFTRLVREAGLQKRVHVDSAGTHDYHIGEAPDPRTQQAALKRGVDLSRLRARVVMPDDLEEYDYILAMDRNNYAHLQALSPPQHRGKIRLFLEFAGDIGVKEVPDPYFGGAQGFDYVLDLAEAAAQGLLEEVRLRLDGGGR